MKKIIAIAASAFVNVGLIVAFEDAADDARPLPSGEVIVTDLSGATVPLAQVSTALDGTDGPVAL